MTKITKETLMPVGLVMSLVGLAFNLGKSSKDMDSLNTRVQAIELDRAIKIDNYQHFQLEVIQRLTRIEEAVSAGESKRRR